jgi:hypothetical protein
VQILYGGPLGLVTFGDQFLAESLVDPQVNAFDRFGEALTASDFDLDGRDDLVIGAPLDNSLGVPNAGEATVLYGTATGLSFTGHQVFDMIFFGSLDAGDEFGFAMAAGRFGTRGNELAVGIPNREVDGSAQAGAVLVISSQVLFADGLESGTTIAWATESP